MGIINKEATAENLRTIRMERGLTQKDVAEFLGKDSSGVTEWEKARCLPNAESLVMLSAIYGVTIEELLVTHI